jgi:YD repeat-containing protein
MTEKFIYNGVNLVQDIIYDYSSSGTTVNDITNYTYDNQGNLISTVDSYGKSDSISYYTNLTNNFNLGDTFLPIPKYFVKSVVTTVGTTTTLSQFYYTFDDKNRLIKDSVSIYSNGKGGSHVYSYTY